MGESGRIRFVGAYRDVHIASRDAFRGDALFRAERFVEKVIDGLPADELVDELVDVIQRTIESERRQRRRRERERDLDDTDDEALLERSVCLPVWDPEHDSESFLSPDHLVVRYGGLDLEDRPGFHWHVCTGGRAQTTLQPGSNIPRLTQ